ncbi:helix-turn-helix transcriptional regulator, partial [Shigella dysenteriae]
MSLLYHVPGKTPRTLIVAVMGNDSNLLIVFYVQIMP